MDSRSLISSILFEAADLNQGNVGVELEFLLRKDFMAGEAYEPGLVNLFGGAGFTVSGDGSVKPRRGTLEVFYVDCEIATAEPAEWPVIAPNLSKVLAWLKRSDHTLIARGRSADKIFRHVGDKPVDPSDPRVKSYVDRGYKLLKMPRAKVPSNYTAGVHIHFDVKSWFGSVDHAESFIKFWNRWQKSIPSHVPAGRYGDDTGQTRANFHASVDTDVDIPKRGPESDDITGPLSFISKIKTLDRYRALNTAPALYRGDIEFRFLHGTLNFETISGWVRALAEVIEFSKSGGDDFEGYLNREAPETADFMARTRQRSSFSKDPTSVQKSTPRGTARLFKTAPQRRRPSIFRHPLQRAASAIRDLSLPDEPAASAA